jgi:hypothetical protein
MRVLFQPRPALKDAGRRTDMIAVQGRFPNIRPQRARCRARSIVSPVFASVWSHAIGRSHGSYLRYQSRNSQSRVAIIDFRPNKIGMKNIFIDI